MFLFFSFPVNWDLAIVEKMDSSINQAIICYLVINCKIQIHHLQIRYERTVETMETLWISGSLENLSQWCLYSKHGVNLQKDGEGILVNYLEKVSNYPQHLWVLSSYERKLSRINKGTWKWRCTSTKNCYTHPLC